MLSHSEYSNSAEAETAYSGTISSSSCSMRPMRKTKKTKNKRRFSDEQIKSLESMFETEWRLEPRKKLQVARELGLQPRQVAIWFQNKRAGCKSKQLQRDYTLLHANYNALASKFESLNNENHALLLQLQKLNEQMKIANGESSVKCEAEVKQSPSSMEMSEQVVIGVVSDEDSSLKTEYFGLEDEHPATLMNFVDHQHNTDGSLTSPEDWGKLETDDDDCLLGQPGSAYQWWDFWS